MDSLKAKELYALIQYLKNQGWNANEIIELIEYILR